MTENDLKKSLEGVIKQNGFDLFGVLSIGESLTFPRLAVWLDEGMNGTMDWMARPDTVTKRAIPEEILPGAKTIIILAFEYTIDIIPDELLNDPSRGIIGRYALYDDYHEIIKKKLHCLVAGMQEEVGSFEWKAYTDTGPVLEREWAERAGIGFIGRNSNLINYSLGSYLFLAEILIDIELPEIKREQKGGCARCTSCVDDCPTGAIVQDGLIDARKCISFLTIENRGAIPVALRPLLKNRIYGCDICQEVCPWNKNVKAQKKSDFQVRPDLIAPKLSSLIFFDDKSFRQRFKKSPIKRAKREGFMRNVAVALGNWQTAESRELLEQIVKNDLSELVREHAQWGLDLQ